MKIMKLPALMLLLVSQVSIASTIQSLQSIQDAVKTYVNSSLEVGGNYQISETQFDPRLQLPLCEQPLKVFAQAGAIKAGRNTIGVRCDSSKSWMIYTVIGIKSYKDVLVLSKSLSRGELIRAEDIVTEARDIATLQQGYLLDPSDVINKQASRNLAAGSVLNKLSYEELILIRRGERVNIQSGKDGLLISATGTALMDGAKGERISVKNITSQRVIQAVVVDPGLVSVPF
ncbi:MAG: flagellar basal body P-ring formation chaperone FlgA [Methylomonas sp.]